MKKLWPSFIFFALASLLLGCNALMQNGERDGRPSLTPITEPEQEEDAIEEGVTRPDGQVYIQSDYCVCLNSKQYSFGNCAAICQRNPTTAPTLIANVALGPDIELNAELGSLLNWCTVQIGDGNINPSCVLEAFDGQQTRTYDAQIFTDSEGFRATVTDLQENVPYVMKLKEVSSGAQSSAFQVTLKDFSDDDFQTMLRSVPVHQYTCVNTAGAFNDSSREYEFAIKTFYYFRNKNRPPAIPPAAGAPINIPPQNYCHDWRPNKYIDSLQYPRLETVHQVFHMWDGNDPRFFDIDPSDGVLDVNNYIQQELADRYGFDEDPNLVVFVEFKWPSSPTDSSSITNGSSAGTVPSLGFIMQAFVETNSQTNRAETICPDQKDYAERGPIFSILGEIVGTDTEAIYAARREPMPFEDDNGRPIAAPDAFVLIRESLLNTIWFYYDGEGRPTPADKSSAETETIHFFWPPCDSSSGCDPTLRQANQSLFTVRAPDSLFAEPGEFGFRTERSPADKRFGCVPKGSSLSN